MLNILSIKELLHKPVEIQWNIAGTLPGKLKRNILGASSYKILPPQVKKMLEMAIFEILWGPRNQCRIPGFFMILWISESFSLYLSDKNSFNFKLVFFTYCEYISGGIIRKNILPSDYLSAWWYWCKKNWKNFPQSSDKFFFLLLNYDFFIVMSISKLW